MVWVVIERIVHLLTLMLLILMISIVMTNNKSSEDIGNFGLKIDQVKQDTLVVIGKNVDYVDRRINGIAETQDRYQVGMDQRVYIVEQRIKELQSDKKSNQKIITNNINTNLNNNVQK